MLRYTDYDIVFREIPDETTLAVNLAGCPNHCPGCHSPQLQEPIGEPLTEEVVERLLARYGAAVTCFCLMGGDAEPHEANEQSIAWKVAERAVEEGAEIVLTNTAVSIRMGTIGRLAEKCNTIVVPADATSVEDLENLIDKTMEHFGGKFDFMLHSIGMSPNVRKGRTYDDLDYDYLAKTLDISAISFHKAIQVARKKDALHDWGSIVALSLHRGTAYALRL